MTTNGTGGDNGDPVLTGLTIVLCGRSNCSVDNSIDDDDPLVMMVVQ